MPNRARIYVGGLSRSTSTRKLLSLFSRYGRLRDVDLKTDYAFVVRSMQEFEHSRDAQDALEDMHRRTVDGHRITVEYAVPPHEHSPKDICFNCGGTGHWARDCKQPDLKGRCYRCGEKGHERRHCPSSRSRSRQKDRPSDAPLSVLNTSSHSPERRDEYD